MSATQIKGLQQNITFIFALFATLPYDYVVMFVNLTKLKIVSQCTSYVVIALFQERCCKSTVKALRKLLQKYHKSAVKLPKVYETSENDV